MILQSRPFKSHLHPNKSSPEPNKINKPVMPGDRLAMKQFVNFMNKEYPNMLLLTNLE